FDTETNLEESKNFSDLTPPEGVNVCVTLPVPVSEMKILPRLEPAARVDPANADVTIAPLEEEPAIPVFDPVPEPEPEPEPAPIYTGIRETATIPPPNNNKPKQIAPPIAK
ncbi:unnamed protein product, partial [Brachionus calyciflorus]